MSSVLWKLEQTVVLLCDAGSLLYCLKEIPRKQSGRGVERFECGGVFSIRLKAFIYYQYSEGVVEYTVLVREGKTTGITKYSEYFVL